MTAPTLADFDTADEVIDATAGLVAVLTAVAVDSECRDDPDHLAHLLDALRDVKTAAAETYAQVEAQLLACMGEKTREVPGLGLVEVKRKTARKQWDNDSLWRLVVARARDERRLDEATGVYESEGEAVGRVLAECARPSWRLEPLRARNIDPDDYCTTTPEGYSVQLPPRQVA